ncbi:MAG: T9SS type A sorting domain-containing protein [Bacteroidetes bacterium]|nr:T9SS type A sorting domain-containing protein [Bacteroidota bacterium]
MKKLITLLLAALLAQAVHAQWSIVGQAFIGTVRAVYFQDVNTGFAAGGDGATLGFIAKTNDGGVTWTSTSISGTILLRSIAFVDENTGYICGHSGVLLKTTDGGNTWTNIYTNASQTFRAIDFISSTTGLMAGAAGTIWKTTDGGTSWSSTSLGISSDVIQLDMIDENTGYACASSGVSPFGNGYVFKTTDGGTSWSQVYSDASIGFLGMAALDVNTIYAGGTNQNIIKSTDGGLTWSTVFSGIIGPAIRTGFAVTSDRIYMADDNGYIQFTEDAGTNWSNIFYAAGGLYGMHFPTKTIGFAGDLSGNIWKYDAEATCTINAPLPYGAYYITPNSAVLNWESVAGAVKYTVRMRSYYGVSSFNSVANAHMVDGLEPDTKYIWQVKAYCGSPIAGASVWSSKSSFFTDPLRLSSSNSLSFFDVYPNPVVDAATISFTLEEESNVTAMLYTIDGKEIMTITKQHYPAGANQVSFDRGNLSAGIYMVRFIEGDHVITNKIVLQ